MTEPSAKAVTFSGPERLTAMVFPVRRFVFDTIDAPVIRVVMDPFVAWRILLSSSFTGKLTLILNPQKLAGRGRQPSDASTRARSRGHRAGPDSPLTQTSSTGPPGRGRAGTAK